MNKEKALINHRILKWAREQISVSLTDVINGLKNKNITEENLISWENGNDLPTVDIAKKLAKMYGINFIVLYSEEIPKKIKPLKDFRKISETEDGKFSKKAILLMREIQGKQEWIKDYLIGKNKKPLSFINSIKSTQSINSVVNYINRLLLSDIKIKEDTEKTFKLLLSKIENLGVFVSIANSYNLNYLSSVAVSEIRGFAIADEIAPFIFINSKDNKKAQLFTLIHEFCHLLLGKTGISDISNKNTKPTEIFCNKIAAEFLMPTEKFYNTYMTYKVDNIEDKILYLSKKFPTSYSSILIKMKNLNLINDFTFNNLYEKYKNYVPTDNTKKVILTKSTFSDPYLKSFRINGKHFINNVINAYNNNEIFIKNVCNLFGIKKYSKLDKYEDKWNRWL